MNNTGQFIIWMAFIAVDISFVCYVIHHFNANNVLIKKIARFSFLGFTAFITFAAILLMYFILNHEFILSYVARYSSRGLPLQYLISSFWAGQEGSFLLWVLLSAWLGVFLVYNARDMAPQVMIPYNLTNLFLMLLLIKQSPFAMLSHTPTDGQGLNILLQDPWMVIHPPITFLGYAAFAIPFAYAIAALWRRQYDQWIRLALPWTIFAFVSLGAGIIIGGYWSYKVLGWGGYWGWDPVENASLLPWLMGMALMHGMILQRSTGKLRKMNLFLAAISFCLIIYCTFLTRSGILADFSVHSFIDLGITGLLVLFMLICLIGPLFFLMIRAKDIPISHQPKTWPLFSREFGLMAAIIVLSFMTIIIGLGTSAPLITRVISNPSNVSPEFYVKTNLLPAMIMLLLLCIVPYIHWGKNDISRLPQKFIWPLAGVLIVLAVMFRSNYPGTALLALSLFAGVAVSLNLIQTFQLMKKRFTLAAGAMAHLGIGLMFVGIISSSVYDRSEKVSVTHDMVKTDLGYDMRLLEPEYMEVERGVHVDLPIEFIKGTSRFIARPNIHSERTPDGRLRHLARPHIKRGPISDLYISTLNFNPGEDDDPSAYHIILKRGERFAFNDYEFLFLGFDLKNMMGNGDGRDMEVGADIEVSYKGGNPIRIKPVFSTRQGTNPQARVKLPGPQNAVIILMGLDAGAKTIHLDYEGPRPEGSQKAGRKSATVIAEVAVKPGMTVLWLGVSLILFGGCMGIARHWSK